MLPDDIRYACTHLRSRLVEVQATLSDPASVAPSLNALSESLQPSVTSVFSGDLGPELRPYSVEIHKELRLLQMDVARWNAARQAETQRSRLAHIQTRSDRLLSYLDAVLGSEQT